MKYLLFITTLLISNVYGQKKLAEALLPTSGTKWSEGRVVLNDGTQLTGLLSYNANTGALNYQQGEDSRLFLSRNVFSFEFLDLETKKNRIFYSLSYEDANTNNLMPFFFEVFFEFEKFSVISKIDLPIINVASTYNTSPNGTMTSSNQYYYNGFSVTETIYIMDTNGKIEPFVQIVDTEYDRKWSGGSRTKNKVLNKHLLRRYTEPFYDKLVSFVQETEMSFKNKGHLIIIFEHYAKLLSNK